MQHKGLVVRGSSHPARRPRQESVGEEPVMSKPTRTVRSILEMDIRFEPTRLAAEYVADAYAQVAPIRV